MHIVIMGCGRVGTGLALELESLGHSIAIIDQDKNAFRRLGPNFKGRTIAGIGFDRDILLEAGIEKAEAFAAVSNGDNSNILAARVARETYGVENVVARIYDPARAEIYQRLGIPTVATVIWTQDQFIRRLTPDQVRSEWQDASGNIILCEMPIGKSWIGLNVEQIEKESSARVGFITRFGEGMLTTSDTIIQDGDIIHMLVIVRDVSKVEAILARDVL